MTKTPLIFDLAAATTAQQFTAELAKKTDVRLISQLQCERAYYDSFDWRLFAAGYVCAIDKTNKSLTLSLSDLQAKQQYTPLKIHQIPKFAWEIDNVRMRDKLEQLLEMRALLPVLTLQSLSSKLIVLNKDEKTVLRLVVEEYDNLTSRVILFPIKGYDKAFSRIEGKRELDGLIKGTDFENLDFLPAYFSFRNLDLLLETRKKPTQRLKKLLEPLANDYAFVFLDCPPNISLLSEAVFGAADYLLSPIIPTTLSLRTLQQLKKFINQNSLKELELLAFFSMVDKRKKLHREIIATLPKTQPEILNSTIPYASDVERMGLERMPLGGFVSNSPSLGAYNALWQEVFNRVNGQLEPKNKL